MNPIKLWNQFFFGPISARPLGAFRIAFGSLLVMYLLVMNAEFDFFYTPGGLMRAQDARSVAGPLRISPLNFTDNPVAPHVVHWATLAAAVGFTLGWRTRIMSVLLYLGMLTLYHRNVTSNGGPDAMPAILCFYTMLCPCGKAFSLDARREAKRRGNAADALIVPWGVRLLQMQMCLMYFQSCVIKCQGKAWLDGTTVHYILFNHEFGQFNLEWMAGYPLLINLMTHGALLIEFALAFWLWFRPTRRWAILGGVLLHAGIRPILNVTGFGEVMISTYLTFLAADELDSLLHALDPRAWLARLGLKTSWLAELKGARGGGPQPGWRHLELPFDGEPTPASESPAMG